MADFLATEPSALTEPIELEVGRPEGCGWQILPGEGGGDGFFYARVRKE